MFLTAIELPAPESWVHWTIGVWLQSKSGAVTALYRDPGSATSQEFRPPLWSARSGRRALWARSYRADAGGRNGDDALLGSPFPVRCVAALRMQQQRVGHLEAGISPEEVDAAARVEDGLRIVEAHRGPP